MAQKFRLLPVLLIVSAVTGAQAFECGGSIALGGQTVVLDRDIAACADGDAFTIEGPGTFDMNGHAITCTGAFYGLQVLGAGAIVRDGIVSGCDVGVVVTGTSHQIVRMVARANKSGYEIAGRGSVVRNSLAADNGSSGFKLVGGDLRVKANVASGNQLGFAVHGSDNVLAGNTAVGNQVGLENEDAPGNRFVRNTAVGNQAGIHNSLGTEATFRRNLALGNEADLIDSKPNCDANTWEANTFASANKPCVQ